jgi:poly-gamma-glutamate capsule biosynthesis protein CapA/YwtB (metallophosphatase superfamily)
MRGKHQKKPDYTKLYVTLTALAVVSVALYLCRDLFPTAQYTPPPTPPPKSPVEAQPQTPPPGEDIPVLVEFEEYTGEALCVYYNPLVTSEDAFDAMPYGYMLRKSCMTPREFYADLERYYSDGYVLRSSDEMFIDTTGTGRAVFVPIGKKPLALFYDNPNYDSRFYGDMRLVTDANGRLATQLGGDTELPDLDVVSVLESFILDHPDFSPFGERGIIALGGDSIFGYPTESDELHSIITALELAGWRFASRGYDSLRLGRETAERLGDDLDRWQSDIARLVGETNMFVFPFGESVYEPGDARLDALTSRGYSVLFGGGEGGTISTEDYVSVTRRQGIALDGAETVSEPYAVDIAFGGDVLLSNSIGDRISKGDYEGVLDSAIASRFRASDYALVNLETSVSTRGTPIPGKAYTFRSPPENLAFLTDWLGVDAVSLANNHTLDYGWDAFYDTIAYTREYGIETIGVGNNYAEAATPFVIDKNGLRIAVYAGNQIVSYQDWRSSDTKPGQLTAREPKEVERLCNVISEARHEYDYVIVFMHWGIELDLAPSQRQTSTARALVDAGADVVIGAHPHVVQTYEEYGGGYIAYSLGNFMFNSLHPKTVVMYLQFDASGLHTEIVPCVISGTKTKPADG